MSASQVNMSATPKASLSVATPIIPGQLTQSNPLSAKVKSQKRQSQAAFGYTTSQSDKARKVSGKARMATPSESREIEQGSEDEGEETKEGDSSNSDSDGDVVMADSDEDGEFVMPQMTGIPPPVEQVSTYQAKWTGHDEPAPVAYYDKYDVTWARYIVEQRQEGVEDGKILEAISEFRKEDRYILGVCSGKYVSGGKDRQTMYAVLSIIKAVKGKQTVSEGGTALAEPELFRMAPEDNWVIIDMKTKENADIVLAQGVVHHRSTGLL
ncbi:hypothetical protein BDZ94DRAFT_1278417, partial [Collybia nuda]